MSFGSTRRRFVHWLDATLTRPEYAAALVARFRFSAGRMPEWQPMPLPHEYWLNSGNTSAANDFVGHTHVPFEHVWLAEQVPHEPPQPSLPHVFPAQLGAQPHWPAAEHC